MLMEFSSVVDAVRGAVEIQRAMVDRNAGIAEDGHWYGKASGVEPASLVH
jgi:hypothetical protein